MRADDLRATATRCQQCSARSWRRALTALALACEWLGRARPRNVVLISVDTLRRGSLRPFRRDAAELPNLDALAHRSVIFETALSPAAWTLPAHASLLTGLYPIATAPPTGPRGTVERWSVRWREPGGDSAAGISSPRF